jgi:hypothetical protein
MMTQRFLDRRGPRRGTRGGVPWRDPQRGGRAGVPFLVLAVCMAVVFGTLDARVAGQETRTGASTTVTPRMPDGHPDLNGMWYRRVPSVPPVQRGAGSRRSLS